VARTWISFRCVPCHPWCTHRTSLVVKKNVCTVAVNNSIKVGPLVFLLYIFVITESIMKRPVLFSHYHLNYPRGFRSRMLYQLTGAFIPCPVPLVLFSVYGFYNILWTVQFI
jgi:hypothetical protein